MIFHTILLTRLHILYDRPYFVLNALQTYVVFEFRHNLFFRLRNEAFGCIDIVCHYGFITTEDCFYIYGLRHILSEVTVKVTDVGLTHIPCEVSIEYSWQVVRCLHIICLVADVEAEFREVGNLECIKTEVKVKQTCHFLIMFHEGKHICLQTAQQHDWSFQIVHKTKEFIKTVHVVRFLSWHQFLCICDEQNTIFDCRHVFIEVTHKLIPVGSVHLLGCMFNNPRRNHLRSDEMGNKILSRTRVAEDKAVKSDARTVLYHFLRHLELVIKIIELRDDGILSYQSLLGSLLSYRFSTESTIESLLPVFFSTFVTSHNTV